MKSKVEKLDVDKLVPVPVYLSKLSNVGKIDVVKKDVYDDKIKNIEDILSDINNLETNTTLYAKTDKVQYKIPSITKLLLLLLLTLKWMILKTKYLMLLT